MSNPRYAVQESYHGATYIKSRHRTRLAARFAAWRARRREEALIIAGRLTDRATYRIAARS